MIPIDEGTAQAVRSLQPRDVETLIYLSKGMTQPEIGVLMHLSRHTVHDRMKKIFRVLDVGTRCEAAVIACKCGLV